jgi:hypothetical protein
MQWVLSEMLVTFTITQCYTTEGNTLRINNGNNLKSLKEISLFLEGYK